MDENTGFSRGGDVILRDHRVSCGPKHLAVALRPAPQGVRYLSPVTCEALRLSEYGVNMGYCPISTSSDAEDHGLRATHRRIQGESSKAQFVVVVSFLLTFQLFRCYALLVLWEINAMSAGAGTSKELESLFVDDSEQAIDALIRTTLAPLVGLTRDGKIVARDAFLKLSLPARILAVALAHLALTRLGVPDASVHVSAERLAIECMAPLKACRESLSRLKAKNVLSKDASGYFVPVWAVAKIVGEIK
jgi:hypothetical protein